ncbi:MAG: PKD domain-containing protein [Bacteroidota bacterium]
MNKGLPTLLLPIAIWLFCGTTSFAQVTADFSASSRTGCGSLQVSFTDRSSSSAGNIVSWSWDLGGVSSSSRNPGRIFGTAGSYTICLTVTDSEGNQDTECKDDYIQILHLPEPEFSVDNQQGCSPLEVTFTDESVGQDGNIVQWIWGLGGSAGVVVNDDDRNVSSTYSVPDNYTISLTLIDENNCTNTVTKSDFILVSPDPVIDVGVTNSSGCEPPLVVSFTNSSDTTNIDYQWDFGNGSSFNGAFPPPTVYVQQGIFSIEVIATNRLTDCSDTLVLQNAIDVGDPVEFIPSAMSGCEDLTVRFTDTSPDPADSVRWGFGNGDNSMQANPTYTYDTPGCYFVTLSRWVDGCLTTRTLTECIEVFQEPDPSYSNNNGLGCEVPHTVNFFGAASGITEWAWDFGDGSTSNVQNPVHTYTEFGVYPVRLTVTNGNGCTMSIATDTIKIIPLSGGVVPTRYFDCTPLIVTLQDQSTTVAPITNWEWTLTNDASSPPIVLTSTDTVPTFTLVDTGRYTITLVIINEIGCVDTTVVEGLIGVGIPPVIDFDATPRVSCITEPIQFTDQSSPYADEWFWEFGDGGESDAQSPIYEYADTGYYDVTLTAFHLGCPNDLEIDSFIFIDPPKAGFTVLRDCESPYRVEMNDMGIGYDRIHWDFGVAELEDDTSNLAEPIYIYPRTGTFTIRQIVWNYTTGCTDTTQTTLNITDPVASFTLDTLAGCIPLRLEINDISEFANVYAWSANGGQFSDITSAEPTLTFTVPGKYTDIQLIVTDINGCPDTLLFTDTVTVNGNITDFTVDPTGGCMPLTVQFNDQSSSTFGTNVRWLWEFGAGGSLGTSNQINPVFEFNEPWSQRWNSTDR